MSFVTIHDCQHLSSFQTALTFSKVLYIRYTFFPLTIIVEIAFVLEEVIFY